MTRGLNTSLLQQWIGAQLSCWKDFPCALPHMTLTHTLPCLCSRRPTGWLCMYGSSIPSSIWFRTMCSSLLHHSCDWSSPPSDASSSCEKHSLKPSNCYCKGRIFPKSPIRPIIMAVENYILNGKETNIGDTPIFDHWTMIMGGFYQFSKDFLALFLYL